MLPYGVQGMLFLLLFSRSSYHLVGDCLVEKIVVGIKRREAVGKKKGEPGHVLLRLVEVGVCSTVTEADVFESGVSFLPSRLPWKGILRPHRPKLPH